MVLVYPNIEQLHLWVKLVEKTDGLSQYLPLIDDRWFVAIESDLILCSIHPDGNDFYKTSARLFYRVIKNHHFIDGNKRSALLIWFLLMLLNNGEFHASWEVMYKLAKVVAETSGRQEDLIADLSLLFKDWVIFKE